MTIETELPAVKVKTSIDTMREAALDVVRKMGWKPCDTLSAHSVVGLMAEFGMHVYRGEVGCGYPDCGCCADAACADAINQHPDFRLPALKDEINTLRARCEKAEAELTVPRQRTTR